MSVALPQGARCLLLGSNGAGKTTLLKILGGKHMVPQSAVKVLGCSPFHDTNLTASGRLSYLGGSWDRDIAFAGYSIPLQARSAHGVISLRVLCSQACKHSHAACRPRDLMRCRAPGPEHAGGVRVMRQGDIPALQMIDSIPGVDPERRRKLMHVLDIDPAWRMHRVSDGQRRRVQICLGLLKPPEVRSMVVLYDGSNCPAPVTVAVPNQR